MKYLLATLLLCFMWEKGSTQTNPYCTLYENHTLCVDPIKGAACGTTGYTQRIPSLTEIKNILHFHNEIRRRTAYGNENKTMGKLPPAKNMLEMLWDKELANISQRQADQCVFQHNCYECRGVLNGRFPTIGQNIALRFFNGTNIVFNYVAIMDGWYSSEVQSFNPKIVNNYVFSGKYGHYSQLIWAKTNYVGCGGSIYKNGSITYQFVVCNYGPAGNYVNSPIYLNGTACTGCPSGTSCNVAVSSICCTS